MIRKDQSNFEREAESGTYGLNLKVDLSREARGSCKIPDRLVSSSARSVDRGDVPSLLLRGIATIPIRRNPSQQLSRSWLPRNRVEL